MDLEQEEQTSVIQLPRVRGDNTVILPPLPLMPEPDAYVQQLDAMTPNMRRNYVKDRTQAALTYITEYEKQHKNGNVTHSMISNKYYSGYRLFMARQTK